MNENIAIHSIYGHLRTGFVAAAPRYTPPKWWQADLWAVSKAMLATEYEVKISRGDFFADCKKKTDPWLGPSEKKHDLLAAGNINGPARFYYVVPSELVTVDEVPAWAGLIEMHCRCKVETSNFWDWPFLYKKKAPQLHGERVTNDQVNQIFRCLHYRFWLLKNCLETSPDMEAMEIEA